MAFYASYDPTIIPTSPVLGWYDVQDADNPDGLVYAVLPPAANLLTLTQAQWDGRMTNPSAWAVEAGSLVTVSAATVTVAPYDTLISGGVIVTSASAPILNGVYALDASTQVDITTEASFITSFQEFTTGGTTNLPWQLANGSFVQFPTTTLFLAFAKAVGQLVAGAKLAAAQSASMPTATITLP